MKYIVAFLLFLTPLAWFVGLCFVGANYGVGAATIYLGGTFFGMLGWGMASSYLDWRM